jgi:hypothetical protein
MGSETEFVLRALAQGEQAWFVPSAIVEHIVRSVQLRMGWIVRRAARFGRGQCRLRYGFPNGPDVVWGLRHPPTSAPRCFGLPIVLLHQMLKKVASAFLGVLQFNRQRLFRSAWALAYLYGYSQEARNHQ